MTRTSEIPPTPCPRCDHLLDRATDLESDAVPAPGDVTVCLACRAVLEFDDEMKLSLAPADTVAEVTAELSRVQNFLRESNQEDVK